MNEHERKIEKLYDWALWYRPVFTVLDGRSIDFDDIINVRESQCDILACHSAHCLCVFSGVFQKSCKTLSGESAVFKIQFPCEELLG